LRRLISVFSFLNQSFRQNRKTTAAAATFDETSLIGKLMLLIIRQILQDFGF